jgi:Holliday junction resolvasome RuvABC endonuclease subunit
MILGIDPGVSGGLAFIGAHEATTGVYDMPVTRATRGKTAMDVATADLIEIITFRKPLRAFVEQVTSRPRQGGQFAFGVNYGRILGALEAAGIPITHVSAQKWKQTMGLRGEDKAMSVKLAAELFPSLKSQLYGPRGAGLDGRAEALLIAYYGAHHS